MMPFDDPVPRWLTVVAVSPITIVTCPSGTSSSSATICANEVPTPMPASILPTFAVTLPSEAMRSHESRSAGSTFAGHAAPGAGSRLRQLLDAGAAGDRERDDQRPAGFQEIAARHAALRHDEIVRHGQALRAARRDAASFTARRMLMCVPQRHLRPASPRRISSSEACGFASRSAAAVMIQPLMQ